MFCFAIFWMNNHTLPTIFFNRISAALSGLFCFGVPGPSRLIRFVIERMAYRSFIFSKLPKPSAASSLWWTCNLLSVSNAWVKLNEPLPFAYQSQSVKNHRVNSMLFECFVRNDKFSWVIACCLSKSIQACSSVCKVSNKWIFFKPLSSQNLTSSGLGSLIANWSVILKRASSNFSFNLVVLAFFSCCSACCASITSAWMIATIRRSLTAFLACFDAFYKTAN